MPAIYSDVLQELLVMQHFVRYAVNYKYDEVFAVGLLTVFEQLFDSYRDEETRAQIFAAYITALDERPDQYKVRRRSSRARSSTRPLPLLTAPCWRRRRRDAARRGGAGGVGAGAERGESRGLRLRLRRGP
eukprot:scaffold1284_cov353-Prasinococcus_capsulatus_cf.AAC.4